MHLYRQLRRQLHSETAAQTHAQTRAGNHACAFRSGSFLQYSPHQPQLYQGPVAPAHSYPYTVPMQPGAGIPCYNQFSYWEQMAAAQLARKRAVQEEMRLMSGGHGMMGQASCSGSGHSVTADARNQVQGPGTVVRQPGQAEGGTVGVYTSPGSQREIEAGLAASIGSS